MYIKCKARNRTAGQTRACADSLGIVKLTFTVKIIFPKKQKHQNLIIWNILHYIYSNIRVLHCIRDDNFVLDPAFFDGDRKVATQLGVTVSLHCSVCANPPVQSFEWSFNNDKLGRRTKLEVWDVKKSSLGNYTCTTSSRDFTTSHNIQLVQEGLY